jgi:formyltetrahydrofolate synthetase
VCSSKYGVPVVVAINAFASDSKGEYGGMFDCCGLFDSEPCSSACVQPNCQVASALECI